MAKATDPIPNREPPPPTRVAREIRGASTRQDLPHAGGNPSDARRALTPGTLVAGRYRIDATIGVGGMGTVYRAEHIHMRRMVAIKVLHREMSDLPEVVSRFEREAVAVARIAHPNVAEATDFGRLEDGSFYLVLEYIEGQSLRELLVHQGKLAPFRALHITRQIASALSAAHRAGVIHRDLKPENVMLLNRHGDADFVKVLDFGIAKLTTDEPGKTPLTQYGTVFGTPDYMSPEQAAGNPVDHRGDLYTTGIVLYEMLSGVSPFEGNDMLVVLTRQMTEAPPPLPSWVEPGVAELVFTLLAKLPERRLASADELVWRIDALLGGPAALFAATANQGAPPSSLEPRSWAAPSGAARPVPQTLPEVPGIPAISAESGMGAGRSVPPNQAVPESLVSAGSVAPSRVVRGSAGPVSLVYSQSGALPSALRLGDWEIPLWAIGLGLSLPLGLVVGTVLFLAAQIPYFHSVARPSPSLVHGEPRPVGSSSTLGQADPALEARASQGDATALQALEGRTPGSLSQFFAMGQGYALAGQWDKSAAAYERALGLDPTVVDKAPLLRDLRHAADDEGARESVFHLAVSILGSHGPDLVFDVWEKSRSDSQATQKARRARQLLDDPALREHASPAARVAIELRDAKGCAEYRALLPRVIEAGDQRAVGVLTPLLPMKGCGAFHLFDCWPCLGLRGELQRAIQASSSRAAPQF